MKRFLSITLLPGLAFFLLTSLSIRENPQDPPRGKKTEKHIKMVKVDDDGKKLELDTVITGDEPFVWNGDTIGRGKEFMWISKDDFKMDSLEHYNFEFDGEGNEKVIIRKSGKGGDNMIWMSGHQGAPMPPHAPGMMMFRSHDNRNIIDLSDPGIISYDKKIQKDGTEKITIVRKQLNEDDGEVIHIKEFNEGDEKKIEVEVEKKVEKENK